MSEPSTRELTIDELARETGMTVRNIRAHQSRGLLPPPVVRVRTGYYGPDHVERVRLIQEMQADGFNLKAIQRLIAASNGGGQHVLEFGRAAIRAFSQEEPEQMTRAEIQQRVGVEDERALRKAVRIGVIRELDDGTFEIPSPTLMNAGAELVEMGVPLMHMLAVAEQIQRNARSIAESFARLFVEDVAGSIDAESHTAEEWAELAKMLDRLRPIATEAVAASFQQEMTGVVERRLQQALGRR